MSEALSLKAVARPKAGKGASRAIRRDGMVPAVMYGDKQPTEAISLDPKGLMKVINSGKFHTAIIEVEVAGKSTRTLMRDIQLHPVTDRALHVDFMRVGKDSKVTVEIPVHFRDEAESPGLKRGAVLNIVRHEIEVTCPADQIPVEFIISLKGREIGDSIHMSAITLPDGVKPAIRDRDFTIATIIAPSGLKSDDAAAVSATPEAAPAAAGKAAPAAAVAAKPAAKK